MECSRIMLESQLPSLGASSRQYSVRITNARFLTYLSVIVKALLEYYSYYGPRALRDNFSQQIRCSRWVSLSAVKDPHFGDSRLLYKPFQSDSKIASRALVITIHKKGSKCNLAGIRNLASVLCTKEVFSVMQFFYFCGDITYP